MFEIKQSKRKIVLSIIYAISNRKPLPKKLTQKPTCIKRIDYINESMHHKNNKKWSHIVPKHTLWLPNLDNNIEEEMQEKSSNTKEAFGFYCPQSNKFYYVENQEVYVQLLRQLAEDQSQNLQVGHSSHSQDQTTAAVVNEDDNYSRMMDDEIEAIFLDPLFATAAKNIQLKQYDF